MNLLIPGVFLFVGFVLLFIDLVFIERKPIGQMLVTLQFGVPKKPLGIVANLIVIVSAIVLMLAYTGII